jgi:hypothetical protein
MNYIFIIYLFDVVDADIVHYKFDQINIVWLKTYFDLYISWFRGYIISLLFKENSLNNTMKIKYSFLGPLKLETFFRH